MHFLSLRLSSPTEWSLATEHTQCCTRVCGGDGSSRGVKRHAWFPQKHHRRRTYAAVLGGDDELRDLASVDTENVLHLAGEDVPDDDGEVHAPGHQGALVVARRDLIGVQDARHLVAVPPQGPVGGPACEANRAVAQTRAIT